MTVQQRRYYQELKPLTKDDYQNLKKSIEEHGVLVPILVDETGAIIDGHHRAQACQELGIPCPQTTAETKDEDAKRTQAVEVNLARRHLPRDELVTLWRRRRDEIEVVLKADPKKSNRAVAEEVGVHHVTVAKERAALERSGDISTRDTAAEPEDENVDAPFADADIPERLLKGYFKPGEWILKMPSEQTRKRGDKEYMRESKPTRIFVDPEEIPIPLAVMDDDDWRAAAVNVVAGALYKDLCRKYPL